MQLTLTEWNGLLKFKHGFSEMVVYELALEGSNGQCLFFGYSGESLRVSPGAWCLHVLLG